MTQTLREIIRLASEGYHPTTQLPTANATRSLRRIAELNHEILRSTSIANAVCDAHHCVVVRLQEVERLARKLQRRNP